jgi:hypothetical protein
VDEGVAVLFRPAAAERNGFLISGATGNFGGVGAADSGPFKMTVILP